MIDAMRKILIIDDERDSIAVFEFLLSKLAYQVVSINNPLLAIDKIQREQPDLIIMDWMMPQMEGIDVLTSIKSVKEFYEIPVLIASGLRTESHSLKLAIEAGAIDLIKKPIDEIELEARVNSALKMADYIKEVRKMQDDIHAKELELLKVTNKSLNEELTKIERETILAAVNVFQERKQIDCLKEVFDKESFGFSAEQFARIIQVLDRYENMTYAFNWDKFQASFSKLNTQFYANLLEKHPDLSTGDLQICSYYKLGMNAKDITILNYSTLEAVRKAVYRLRKKLLIDEKVNLNLYLQAF